MAKLFLSYSSKDRDFVMRLAEDLKRAGYEVWLDRWKISGRQPYWDEIQTGIESCTHFLFIVSPDSIEKTSGARKELYHAGGLKPSPQIVPIMMRDTPYNRFPILISPGEYQIHDFVNLPYQTAFGDVIEAIQRPPTGAFPAAQADSVPTRPVMTGQRSAAVSPSRPASYRQPNAGSQIKMWQIILGVLGIGGVSTLLLAILVLGLLGSRRPGNDPTATIAIVSTSIPEPATKISTEAAASNLVRVTPVDTSSVVNIRTGPGVNYPRFDQLKKGNQLQAIGRSADFAWIVVNANNKPGWMSVDLLVISGDWGSLPVVVAPPTPIPSATPVPTATPTLVLIDGSPTPVTQPTIVLNSTFVIVMSPCNSPKTSRMKVGGSGKSVVDFDLKIWSNTTSTAKSVGVLTAGETFDVADGPSCVKNIPYWEIKTNNEIGWVAEMSSSTYYIGPTK
jgi:hypothetical protein